MRPLAAALKLWLKLTRETGHFQAIQANSGFYQSDAEDANILRLEIPMHFGVFPMISGHKNRFAIKFIEFESGNKLYFEQGFAYHFNTYKPHRWNFNSNPSKNRSALVIGWSPWLDFDGHKWTTNQWTNKVHPMDMVKQGLVL